MKDADETLKKKSNLLGNVFFLAHEKTPLNKYAKFLEFGHSIRAENLHLQKSGNESTHSAYDFVENLDITLLQLDMKVLRDVRSHSLIIEPVNYFGAREFVVVLARYANNEGSSSVMFLDLVRGTSIEGAVREPYERDGLTSPGVWHGVLMGRREEHEGSL